MSCNAIQYKLGTSLSLSITADSTVGDIFVGATLQFFLYSSAVSRTNPAFASTPWTTHVSGTKTLFNLAPNDLVVPTREYWASVKIVKSTGFVTIEDFRFQVNIFEDDTVQDGQNLILGSQNSGLIFALEAVTTANNTAPPRIYNENLTSQINNSTNTFTTAFPMVSGSEEIKLNGISQTLLDDYILLNTTQFQFTTIPVISDRILISYNKL